MPKRTFHTYISILVTLFVWIPVQAYAQEQKAAPIKAAYSADQVSPSTYVIHGPVASPTPENQGFMNNPAFIIGDTGVIVIDSGSTVQVGDMVVKMIKTVSDLPVVATFSTHIHGDHWLGNQAIAEAYPNAKHYAHPNMIEQANAGEGQSWVDQMLTLSEGASAGTIFYPPDITVNEATQLTIAGKTFVIYHDTIAHTNTDVSILLKDESVLFLGDTVMKNRVGRMDDGNFKGLIAFLDRMLALDAEVYVPGHGATGSKQVVEEFQGLMNTIYTTVEEHYEGGLTDFEIKPLVENKIVDPESWSDLDEALGKLVSLAYLEVEEDSF